MSTTLAAAMTVPTNSLSKTETGRVTFPNAIPVTPLQGEWREKLPEHSKEEIEAAKKALVDNRGMCSGTANWFCSSDKWKTYTSYLNKACHANLPYMSKTNYETVIALENGWARNSRGCSRKFDGVDEKNLSRSFLTWFLYHSPYGEFILNRDDLDFCLEYGFVVSGEIPHAILMNLAIISRHFYEVNKDCFAMFDIMTMQKGVDPTIAYSFLFNSYYSYYGETYVNKKFQGYSGHRVTGVYSPLALMNLFKGVFGTKAISQKMFAHGSTSGAASLFFTKDIYASTFYHWTTADEGREFRTALAAYRKPDADLSTYKPPNPFVRADPYADNVRILSPGEFTYQELFDFAMEWTDTYVRQQLAKEKK